jgi:branched-chain amino acid transport system ATP-binding protein
MAALTLLSTTRLSRAFGGLLAVDAVSFELRAGEIRAIIGPNGAGKTTFVSLICGRVDADDGEIIFDGDTITALPAFARVRLGIAYTFQITSIFKNLTALENVMLAAQSGDARGCIARARESLGKVGLVERSDARAGDLPYGHQRLLEVAMALALQPKLLILDEPTQGLSDAEIAAFCDLIRAVSTEATVLLIEHNMDVVMQLAHRITVMNQGRILAEGTPSEISASAAVQQAYLGG